MVTLSSNATTYTPTKFSKADAYGLQAQWYANQWNNALAQAYWDIANNLWNYSNFANTSLGTMDALLNYIRANESWLQWKAWTLYNTLAWDIQNQRDYVMNTFGPEWTLTKEVNAYYDDLWNYLATDAWRQAANIAAQWTHSWASLGSIRAQQNEAYNESFNRYIQAKEQQINAKQNIAANLVNFMTSLRQEYWDTTNQYIIDLYKRANDLYNTVAQSAASDLDNYNMLRLQASGGWTVSPSTTTDTTQLTQKDIKNIIKDNGIAWLVAINQVAPERLPQIPYDIWYNALKNRLGLTSGRKSNWVVVSAK